jgi:DNA-binding transcriptional MerR regulator
MFNINTIKLNDLLLPLAFKGFSLKDKKYSISDTNITSRQMHYWEDQGILLFKHKRYYTHRFSFKELLWLRIAGKLREFTISFETIKQIKEELFKETKLKEYLYEPQFREFLNIALDNTDLTPYEKREIKDDQELIMKNLHLGINYFEIMANQLIECKNRVSLIIGIKSSSVEGEEIQRSDSPYWLTLFVPEKLDALTKQSEYLDLLTHNHISLSLNDLLEDVILNIEYKKLPKNLIDLTDSERLLLDIIRSGDYKSINIRFNEQKKPYLAELKEIRKLKKESRLYEIIYKGAYQTIEIKTQEGEIYTCTNTKKIKL